MSIMYHNRHRLPELILATSNSRTTQLSHHALTDRFSSNNDLFVAIYTDSPIWLWHKSLTDRAICRKDIGAPILSTQEALIHQLGSHIQLTQLTNLAYLVFKQQHTIICLGVVTFINLYVNVDTYLYIYHYTRRDVHSQTNRNVFNEVFPVSI